jgi:galactokinase/mevalonate kinase-like predicted kinase
LKRNYSLIKISGYYIYKMSTAAETVTLVARELESQSLNAVVAGFSFAAALSWMDLVRWTVNQVVKVNKNGGMNYTLTALFTTLLSILVYVGISRVSTRVQKPAQPLFAVTR